MESGPPWAGHVGQNHVGGERNSRESQKSRQDNRALWSAWQQPSFLLPGACCEYLTTGVCVCPLGPLRILEEALSREEAL